MTTPKTNNPFIPAVTPIVTGLTNGLPTTLDDLKKVISDEVVKAVTPINADLKLQIETRMLSEILRFENEIKLNQEDFLTDKEMLDEWQHIILTVYKNYSNPSLAGVYYELKKRLNNLNK